MKRILLRWSWLRAEGWSRRSALAWGVFAAASAGFAYSSARGSLLGARELSLVAGSVSMWLVLVDFPGLPRRPLWSELELALPLSLRELNRGRLALTLACWLSPLLVIPVMVGWFVPGAQVLAALASSLGPAGSLVLAAVIRHHGLAEPRSPWFVPLRWSIAVTCAGVGLLWPEPWLGACCLVAAAALRFALHHRPGATAELMLSVGSHGEVKGERARSPRAPGPGGLLLWPMVWGGGGPSAWYLLGALVFGALAFSFGSLLLGVCFVCAQLVNVVVLTNLGKVRALDALPLARRHVFRYLVWPPLLGLLGALALGCWLLPEMGARQTLVSCTPGAATCQVTSDATYLRLTLDPPPPVVSPLGESHTPAEIPVIGTLRLYDPYEAPPGATRDFAGYQLSRLLRDHHAVTLTPEQAKERFIGSANVTQLTPSKHPELASSQTLARFAAAGVFSLLPSLLILLTTVMPHRPATRRQQRLSALERYLVALLVLVPFIALLLLPAFGPGAWGTKLGPALVNEVVQAFSRSPLLAGGLAAATAFALHRWLAHRFEAMEAPARVAFGRSELIEI